MASSFSSVPPPHSSTLFVNFNQPVPVQPEESNFLFWSSEILPFIRSHDLLAIWWISAMPASVCFFVLSPDTQNWQSRIHLLVVSRRAPARVAPFVPHSIDHLPSGWMYYFLFAVVHSWASLCLYIKSKSIATLMELQTTQKLGLFVTDYVQKMKSIADNLAASMQPVSKSTRNLYILSESWRVYDLSSPLFPLHQISWMISTAYFLATNLDLRNNSSGKLFFLLSMLPPKIDPTKIEKTVALGTPTTTFHLSQQ